MDSTPSSVPPTHPNIESSGQSNEKLQETLTVRRIFTADLMGDIMIPLIFIYSQLFEVRTATVASIVLV